MFHHLTWLFAITLGLLACDSKSKTVLSSNAEDEGVVVETNNMDTSSWDLTKIVPLDSVRAMPAGTKMYVRTSVFGEMEDFEVALVSVVDDFVPPMPVVMFKSSRPAVRGQSGSPVFTKDGVIGALSMGFDSENSSPYYFFATPIEWMQKGIIDPEIRSSKPVVWNGNIVRPLALPLLMSGVNNRLLDAAMRKYADKLGDESHLNLLAASGSAGVGGKIEQEFKPGSSLAAALFTGDEVNIGAVGTATYVEGNNILGFGHPFLGNGQTSIPIIGAEVLGEISNLNSPFKFATLGNKVLGTILYDRMPGVGGVIGQEPDMIPLVFSASIFGEKAFSMNHRMARTQLSGFGLFNQAIMTGVTLLSPLANRLDNSTGKSLKVRTEASFTNSDLKVERERIYAFPNSGVIDVLGEALFDFVFSVYLNSVANGYANLEFRSIQMSVDVVDDALFAMPIALEADSVVTAGSDLSVKFSLRVGGSKDADFNVIVAVPDTFAAGIYSLTVGSLYSLGKDADYDDTPSSVEFGNLQDVFDFMNGPEPKAILKVILAFSQPLPTEVSVDSLLTAISEAAKIDSTKSDSTGLVSTMLLPVLEELTIYNDTTSLEKKLDWVLPEGFGSVMVKVLEKK
ncbi:MAG: hypothetical protein Q8Q95_01470 [bacterium]|nr:hypothetical protein [bacterium]